RLDPPETGDTVVISRFDRRAQFSADGRRFVAFRRTPRGAGAEQKELGLAVWDVATGKLGATAPVDKAFAVVAAVSPDGKAVAGQGADPPRLTVWEPDTGRTRWARDLGPSVPFVTFTRGGSRLVVQEVFLPVAPNIIAAAAAPPPGPGPLLVLDAA